MQMGTKIKALHFLVLVLITLADDGEQKTWKTLSPAGIPPTARDDQSAVWDDTARTMLVFGGYDGSYRYDLHRYEVEADRWSTLSPSGSAPTARGGHTAVFDSVSRTMLVFGGRMSSYLNDLCRFDVHANAWSMLLFGGSDGTDLNDLYALEQSTCDAGSQLSGNGSCEACTPGRFSAGGRQACAACAAGHDSEAGSSACQPTVAHVVNGLAEPELSISRIGSAIVRLQVALALLPQEVFNFAGLSYALDIAATEAALSAQSACAAKWEISEDVASIQLNYSELSHPCTTNVTNTESGIRRDGVVGVHLMGESDGALEVIFAWVQELTLTFSALTNASYGDLAIVGFVIVGAQTFHVGGFASTLQLFTSEAFATVKSVKFFISNDVVYVEHKLDDDDGSLTMDVVMVWLSRSSEVSDLDAVKYNLTSVLVRHDEGNAQFVRYSFFARPCQACYLHSLAQVTHGRRLGQSAEISFTLQSLYLDVAADDTFAVEFPEILMGPKAVLCVSAIAAAVTGIFARFLGHQLQRPAFGATSIQVFRVLEAADCFSGVFVLVLIHMDSDLQFANDGGAVFLALATSAGLSIALFVFGDLFRVRWHGRLSQEQKRGIHIALACVHLAVEDSFQTLLYAFVASSQASGGFGVSVLALGGIVKAVGFTAAKILEFLGAFDVRSAHCDALRFPRGVPGPAAPPADPPPKVLGAPSVSPSTSGSDASGS